MLNLEAEGIQQQQQQKKKKKSTSSPVSQEQESEARIRVYSGHSFNRMEQRMEEEIASQARNR